jgi:hypothetical protein
MIGKALWGTARFKAGYPRYSTARALAEANGLCTFSSSFSSARRLHRPLAGRAAAAAPANPPKVSAVRQKPNPTHYFA